MSSNDTDDYHVSQDCICSYCHAEFDSPDEINPRIHAWTTLWTIRCSTCPKGYIRGAEKYCIGCGLLEWEGVIKCKKCD